MKGLVFFFGTQVYFYLLNVFLGFFVFRCNVIFILFRDQSDLILVWSSFQFGGEGRLVQFFGIEFMFGEFLFCVRRFYWEQGGRVDRFVFSYGDIFYFYSLDFSLFLEFIILNKFRKYFVINFGLCDLMFQNVVRFLFRVLKQFQVRFLEYERIS